MSKTLIAASQIWAALVNLAVPVWLLFIFFSYSRGGFLVGLGAMVWSALPFSLAGIENYGLYLLAMLPAIVLGSLGLWLRARERPLTDR